MKKKEFSIKEFRFLNTDELFNNVSYKNWSRVAEWGYVIDQVTRNDFKSIHNTCCGPGEIHKQFCDDLLDCSGNVEVVNSDINEPEFDTNFMLYDITKPHGHHYDSVLCMAEWGYVIDQVTKPHGHHYDLVLCISAIEHIDNADYDQIFMNLFDQVNPGGRLIITVDIPDADVTKFEKILGKKVKKSGNILTGMNSVWAQPQYGHLSIVLIDIQKK